MMSNLQVTVLPLTKEPEMNDTTAQFIESNKANLKELENITSQAFASIEKLVELNMAASKSALADSMSHTKALLGAKDVQELMALQSALVEPLKEKSAAYAQELKTIITDSSANLKKALEAKTAEAQKAITSAIENLTKNTPTGSEAVVAAFKSAMTAGQNAVESAQAQVEKAVKTAQSQFTATSDNVVDVVAKASKTR